MEGKKNRQYIPVNWVCLNKKGLNLFFMVIKNLGAGGGLSRQTTKKWLLLL